MQKFIALQSKDPEILKWRKCQELRKLMVRIIVLNEDLSNKLKEKIQVMKEHFEKSERDFEKHNISWK